ncbi:hypothetical protein [Amygdalobacter nucleatus]|uniref:hypothetical protein n=1 Tax=Amygdalobacter nucleatus TaxID=3029274 RepID=UPI0027A0432A|nr:hypothetical protein [Amygdalobacter nucleatus]WEG36931.1 hypothetical protein PYS63_00345 [Amygdalobacter nucleatus]
MEKLGIDMFPAYSPQVKGKIERLWQTLQSRLPVIFAQNNISSLEAANNFLLSYIPDFNKQFSVEPLDAFSAFVPVSDDFDLDRLLSVTFERNLSAASTVSLHGSLFKIEQHRFHAKTHVTLLLSQKHGLRALINGEFYPISFYDPKNPNFNLHAPQVLKNLIFCYLLCNAKNSPFIASS